jgi:hypothetical protein
MEAASRAGTLAGDTRMQFARQFRSTQGRSGPIPSDVLRAAVEFAFSGPPESPLFLSVVLVADGAPAKQIQLNHALRERSPGAGVAAALWQGEALAWAARGAWDSAMSAADHWTRESGDIDVEARLGAYRLAVAGVLLDALPAAEAVRRRPAAEAAIARLFAGAKDCESAGPDPVMANPAVPANAGLLRCEQPVRSAIYHGSELAWLDGLLAYLQRDPAGIAAARRSLLGASSAGQTARRIFVSPWDSLSRPLLDRLLAVRWLRAAGRDAEAARLLHWHEAVSRPDQQAWRRAIGSISLLDRAEIRDADGDTARALRDYARLLEWYDRPDPALQPIVDRAAAGARRLSHNRY